MVIWSGLTTARAKSWTNCVVGVPNSVVLISTVRFSVGSFDAKNKSTDVKNAPFSSTLNVCDNGSIPTLFLPGMVPKGEPLTLPPCPLLLLDLVFGLFGEGPGLGPGPGPPWLPPFGPPGPGPPGPGEPWFPWFFGPGLGLGLFLPKRLPILFKPAVIAPLTDMPKEPAFKALPDGIPVPKVLAEYLLDKAPWETVFDGCPVKYVPRSSVTLAPDLCNALASLTVYFLYLPSHVYLFVITYLCPPPLV